MAKIELTIMDVIKVDPGRWVKKKANERAPRYEVKTITIHHKSEPIHDPTLTKTVEITLFRFEKESVND